MRTFIVTALHAEAKPLIEKFGLEPESTPCTIACFRNDEMALAVSGIGKIRSAIATTYLLGREHPPSGSIALNIGVCGSANHALDLGQLLVIHEIVDQSSNRTFYPETLMNPPCEEAVLTTFDMPVTKAMVRGDVRGVVDMEASGFFQAALKFLDPTSIICAKVISDFLEDTARVDNASVSELIERNVDSLEQILLQATCLGNLENELLTSDDTMLLKALEEQWQLSVAQEHLLRKWARSYKTRTNRSLQLIRPFLGIPVQTESERDTRFDELRELLLAQ